MYIPTLILEYSWSESKNYSQYEINSRVKIAWRLLPSSQDSVPSPNFSSFSSTVFLSPHTNVQTQTLDSPNKETNRRNRPQATNWFRSSYNLDLIHEANQVSAVWNRDRRVPRSIMSFRSSAIELPCRKTSWAARWWRRGGLALCERGYSAKVIRIDAYNKSPRRERGESTWSRWITFSQVATLTTEGLTVVHLATASRFAVHQLQIARAVLLGSLIKLQSRRDGTGNVESKDGKGYFCSFMDFWVLRDRELESDSLLHILLSLLYKWVLHSARNFITYYVAVSVINEAVHLIKLTVLLLLWYQYIQYIKSSISIYQYIKRVIY